MPLIHRYRLDGNALDSVGTLNGSVIGSLVWSKGLMGQCAEFNGDNTVIYFGTGNSIFPLFNFSFSIWFKSFGTTSPNGTSPALWGFTHGIRLFVYSTYLRFDLDNGSSVPGMSSPSTYDFYNDDQWHHVVCTASDVQRKLYIDGLHVGTLNGSWSGATRWPVNDICIGRDNNDYMYHFRGLMQDFRIYDHILSQKEVQELSKAKVLHYTFNSQEDDSENVVMDSSGQGNNAILDANKPTWTTDSRIGRGAYSFLSSGNKITIPSISSSILTLSAWHKWDTSSTDWRTVFGCSSNIHHLIFNNNRTVNIWDGSQRYLGYSSPDNNWHHYTVIINSGVNALLYVDGVYRGQSAIVLNLSTYPITMIGSGGGSYPCGYLDDVRIYATALSAADIKALYETRASLDSNGNFHV